MNCAGRVAKLHQGPDQSGRLRGFLGARAMSRSYAHAGNARKTDPTIAICHGMTASLRLASIARANRRAASSEEIRNGMRYLFTRVIGVSMNPGQIVTTATPLFASSTRMLSSQIVAAALDAL